MCVLAVFHNSVRRLDVESRLERRWSEIWRDDWGEDCGRLTAGSSRRCRNKRNPFRSSLCHHLFFFFLFFSSPRFLNFARRMKTKIILSPSDRSCSPSSRYHPLGMIPDASLDCSVLSLAFNLIQSMPRYIYPFLRVPLHYGTSTALQYPKAEIEPIHAPPPGTGISCRDDQVADSDLPVSLASPEDQQKAFCRMAAVQTASLLDEHGVGIPHPAPPESSACWWVFEHVVNLPCLELSPFH